MLDDERWKILVGKNEKYRAYNKMGNLTHLFTGPIYRGNKSLLKRASNS